MIRGIKMNRKVTIMGMAMMKMMIMIVRTMILRRREDAGDKGEDRE